MMVADLKWGRFQIGKTTKNAATKETKTFMKEVLVEGNLPLDLGILLPLHLYICSETPLFSF